MHVISGPLDPNSAALEPSSPPVEGRILGQRMNISVGQSSRASVHEGILLKRCRVISSTIIILVTLVAQ